MFRKLYNTRLKMFKTHTKMKTINELVDEMTPKQLQDWCNSQECYDYLNR